MDILKRVRDWSRARRQRKALNNVERMLQQLGFARIPSDQPRRPS